MRVFILQLVIFALLRAKNLEFKPAAVLSRSEPWCVQSESETYWDLAVDDDLFSEADFNRIGL